MKKKRKADLEIHQRPKQGRFLVFTRNIYNIHILNFVFFIHGFHTKVMSQIRLYRLFNDFPTNGACSTMCSISSMHEADLTIITNTQAKIERKKWELNYENTLSIALLRREKNSSKNVTKVHIQRIK